MINKLISLSVSRRWLVMFLTFGAVLWGCWSFISLPIDAVPDITNVQVQINTVSKGLSPEDLELKVTRPIETAMNGIPGIREIRSLTKFGLSQVTLVFAEDTDVYRHRQIVNERLQSSVNLPPGVETPTLSPISTGLGEIFHYTLILKKPSDRKADLMKLKEIQEWKMRPLLQSVQGVAEVNSIGGYSKQIQINPRLRKLAENGLSVADLAASLLDANRNVGGGAIQQEGRQMLVQARGQYADLEQLKQTPVKTFSNFKTMRLSEAADVRFESASRNGAALVNGQEAVIGTVMMLSGSNSRTVAKSVADKVEEIRSQNLLGDDVEIVGLYNRALLVDSTLATVEHNLLVGAGLVMIILFLLLGNFKAAFVVSASIPVTLLITFGFMRELNISGNLMSLGALDFGIIVDAAVIVVDRCVSWMGSRKDISDCKDRIVGATQEIRSAAGFGQLMVIAVFIPILGLVGVEGKMFRPMAQTFSIALFVALILSFTFVPALAAILFTEKEREKVPWTMRMIEHAYRFTLGHLIVWKKVVFALSFLGVVIGGYLFSTLGAEFLPKLDEGSLVIQITRDPSISLEQSVAMQAQSEAVLLRHPAVKSVFSRIGTPEIATDPMGPNEADTFLELKKPGEWIVDQKLILNKDELVSDIVNALKAEVPGQDLSATQPIQMRFNDMLEGTKADLTLKVYGSSLAALKGDVAKISKVLATIRGSGDVQPEIRGTVPLLVLKPKDSKLGSFGLSSAPLLNGVEVALAGKQVGQFYEGQIPVPVVVRLSPEQRNDIDSIRKIQVGIDASLALPLSDLADVTSEEIISPIFRENGKRRSAVLINPRGRDLQTFVEEAKEKLKGDFSIDKGNSLEWSGTFKNLEEAKERLLILGPLALAIVVLMLYSAFRSVKETITILVTVPLALVGGVFGLWATSTPFSISTAVGFVALTGIAVLNGVVMIHFYREYEGSRDSETWVIEASAQRLRAIAMTALVDVFGFLPMVFSSGAGAEIQKPLAITIIGGVVTSTLLTLVVLPLISSLIFKSSVNST